MVNMMMDPSAMGMMSAPMSMPGNEMGMKMPRCTISM